MPSGGHSLSRDLVGAREGVLVSGGGGSVCSLCPGNHQDPMCTCEGLSAGTNTGCGAETAARRLLQNEWLYFAPGPCHMFLIFLNDQK